MFDDIFLNIQGRSKPGKSSRRELPRIQLNRILETKDGRQVRAINCNYEFLLIEHADNLPDEMELLIPESQYTMKCRRTGNKKGLYSVENWKELLFNDAYDFLVNAPEKGSNND